MVTSEETMIKINRGQNLRPEPRFPGILLLALWDAPLESDSYSSPGFSDRLPIREMSVQDLPYS